MSDQSHANLTAREVSAHLPAGLRCSESTLRRYARQGRVPARQVGEHDWRFDLPTVEAALSGRPTIDEDELYPLVERLVRRALVALAKEA